MMDSSSVWVTDGGKVDNRTQLVLCFITAGDKVTTKNIFSSYHIFIPALTVVLLDRHFLSLFFYWWKNEIIRWDLKVKNKKWVEKSKKKRDQKWCVSKASQSWMTIHRHRYWYWTSFRTHTDTHRHTLTHNSGSGAAGGERWNTITSCRASPCVICESGEGPEGQRASLCARGGEHVQVIQVTVSIKAFPHI